MRHKAKNMPYPQLHRELEIRVKDGLVRKTVQGNLALYTYSDKCTYENAWDEYTVLARGLILDEHKKTVLATPFPKFFNVGEIATVPALPFECFEKLDGSLIIGYWHDIDWATATKGSFNSDQAKWAAQEMKKYTHAMYKGMTYLFEAIYPENRIVINYGFSGLFLLAIYDYKGDEVSYDSMQEWAKVAHVPLVPRLPFNSVAELLANAKMLTANEEGYVLRFSDGTRVKIKGDEYCKLHRVISRITPLAIWEGLSSGDSMEDIRRQLPEEFLVDFDMIVGILCNKFTKITKEVDDKVDQLAPLTDKQIGLMLEEIPERIRPFIFAARKRLTWSIEGKTKATLWRNLRPTGNRLEGYTPSSVMNKLAEEDA